MELIKVEEPDYEKIIQSTLKTIFSEEETMEFLEGLSYELEDGSFLYKFVDNSKELGFIVVTPLSEDEEKPDNMDLITIEDIFIKSGNLSKEVADGLSSEIKQLSSKLGINQIEVIVSQNNSWLNESLQESGYISSEVKLEKILPRSNNLDDVLELIQECTPIDRIVQVLLEREEQFRAEIVETSDEIEELIDEGWEPVMVVVTYEPDSSDLEATINESHQLLNWDDYSIVYYI